MAAGFSTAALNYMLDQLATNKAKYVQLHSADPGAAGTTSPTSAARQAAVWSPSASKQLSLSAAENFTGGAASGAVTWVSLWDALTAGNWQGNFQITTGDLEFNAAGNYTLDDITITGS